MDTDERSQKAWISHFVGNWLVQARFANSQGRSAEEIKNELVAKLNSRASGTLVEEVEGLLREYKWENKENIDLFVGKYRKFERKYGLGL